MRDGLGVCGFLGDQQTGKGGTKGIITEHMGLKANGDKRLKGGNSYRWVRECKSHPFKQIQEMINFQVSSEFGFRPNEIWVSRLWSSVW
jgi:hypothetical protein